MSTSTQVQSQASNISTPIVARFFKKATVLRTDAARELMNSKNSIDSIRNQELESIEANNESLTESQIQHRIDRIMKHREQLLPRDIPVDMWLVHLDDKPLLTPKKLPLVVPSKALALGIAAEWNSSGSKVRPAAMPLMTISATTLDVTSDRRLLTIDNILKFIHTDTALVRAPSPPELVQWQSKILDPIVNSFSRRFQVDLHKTHSLIPEDQSENTISRIKSYLESLDNWTLSCIDYATATTKSIVITLTLMDSAISVEQALKAMRTEEDFQLTNFRQVEQAHDIEILDAKVKLGAAITFLQLSKQIPFSPSGSRYIPITREDDSMDIRAWANARHSKMKDTIAKRFKVFETDSAIDGKNQPPLEPDQDIPTKTK